MELEKINNVKIHPVVNNEITADVARKVLGHDLFVEPYANIGILSKKKSGKTTVIFNILKKCAHKNTVVMLFGSTVFKDATYEKINDMLSNKGCHVARHNHFIEDGVNLIDAFIDEASQKQDDEKDEPEAPVRYGNGILKTMTHEEIRRKNSEKPKPLPKPPKPKTIYPEYILVFDDLSESLRHKSISSLVKINRHFKSKIILSSQRITDLHPQALGQCDYVLMFRSFNDEIIETVRKKLDLSITEEEFRNIYYTATEEPYNFLYIDVVREEFRKNFNMKFIN